MKVAFYQRCHGETEMEDIQSCLSTNLETDGFFMEKLMELARRRFPGCQALFTTSCTSALEMAVDCLGLNPGDEVILPSFNFPSAANVVLNRGGIPVLCDIDPDTQNLSLEDVKNRITARTRAVVVVHYAGVSCPMEEFRQVTQEHGISLIEDAAQGIGAAYGGKPLGTLGDFGAISFHFTKNITCGEGGLFLTADAAAWNHARQYRLHGTNRAMYLRGETDRYTWNQAGSCAALNELGAALLWSQFQMVDWITSYRRGVMEQYAEMLEPLESRGMARRMVIPAYAKPNGHICYLRFETENQRERVRRRLLEEGIDCKTHYVPLHSSPMGQKLGYEPGDLPESFRCYQTLLRLPVHTGISGDEVEWISERIKQICGIR